MKQQEAQILLARIKSSPLSVQAEVRIKGRGYIVHVSFVPKYLRQKLTTQIGYSDQWPPLEEAWSVLS